MLSKLDLSVMTRRPRNLDMQRIQSSKDSCLHATITHHFYAGLLAKLS
jgi:hypothetical protein